MMNINKAMTIINGNHGINLLQINTGNGEFMLPADRGAKSVGTWEPSSQKIFKLQRKFFRTKTTHHIMIYESRVFLAKC